MERIQRLLTGDSVVEKMEALRRKYEFLESIKDDIEDELQYEEATSSRKRPRKAVQRWISNVLEKKGKVRELDRDVSSLTCVDRLLNTITSKIESLTKKVDELTEQSRFERGLTLESYDRERVSLLTKRLIGRVFEENKVRILGSVLAGNGSVIGVYGMGGVGKTTLLQHIHNELLLGQPGVHVYWVTVSQNATDKKLLDDIAKIVNVDISDANEEKMIRAAKVKGALDMRQNFVFILDDVWEPIRLEDFGISVGSGGRVVLTTRSLEVCRRMGCRNSIKVEPLDEEEGWTLFRETLGGEETIILPDEIEEVAKCLAKECRGLPLGIITLATSMRGVEDPSEWRDSLEVVREHIPRDDDIMGFNRVLSILEFSYHRLKDLKLQRCFLYCSLFPEDELIERDELITFLIDEGLIDRMRSTKSEFDRGHRILNKLENVCLLEAQKNKKKWCVKMHDLVRDMAIRIALQSPHRHMVKARMGLRYVPSNEKWPEDIKKVSLMYNNIYVITSNSMPNCPSLSTLFLRGNFWLSAIPDNFFQLMKALTILDLSRTKIKSLPGSVSGLGGLTVLLLVGCEELRNVPSLENVTALRRLDLSHTAVVELPKGMERLNNLRYLNLIGCMNLQASPLWVLSKLHRMEWFESDPVISLTGEEVSSWTKLDTFHGNFGDIGGLKACAASWEGREPSKYTIFVGYDNRKLRSHHRYYESVPEKHVHVFATFDTEDANILPSGTRGLLLEDCGGITSLNRMAWLRKATSIEQLSLWFMTTLNDLSLPTNSYSSLKRLNISRCDRVKFLFTPPMLAALRSLESLSVEFCFGVEEIVRGTTDDESTIVSFPPKLVKLNLDIVPNLKSFCSCSIKVSDSLQEIRIYWCENLKRITLLCDEAPSSLKKVVVEEQWWEALEWKHPHSKSVLQPFVT